MDELSVYVHLVDHEGVPAVEDLAGDRNGADHVAPGQEAAEMVFVVDQEVLEEPEVEPAATVVVQGGLEMLVANLPVAMEVAVVT